MDYCKGMMYTVKQGDTLYSISLKYGIPLVLLLRANPYVDVYNLQVGEAICIPMREKECRACCGRKDSQGQDREEMPAMETERQGRERQDQAQAAERNRQAKEGWEEGMGKERNWQPGEGWEEALDIERKWEKGEDLEEQAVTVNRQTEENMGAAVPPSGRNRQMEGNMGAAVTVNRQTEENMGAAVPPSGRNRQAETAQEGESGDGDESSCWVRYVSQPGDTLDALLGEGGMECFLEKNNLDQIYLLPGIAYRRKKTVC